MSIPDCPYCGKPMYIGFVSTGGGDGGWSAIHETEDEDDFFTFIDERGCGVEFNLYRTRKEAEDNYKFCVRTMGGNG